MATINSTSGVIYTIGLSGTIKTSTNAVIETILAGSAMYVPSAYSIVDGQSLVIEDTAILEIG